MCHAERSALGNAAVGAQPGANSWPFIYQIAHIPDALRILGGDRAFRLVREENRGLPTYPGHKVMLPSWKRVSLLFLGGGFAQQGSFDHVPRLVVFRMLGWRRPICLPICALLRGGFSPVHFIPRYGGGMQSLH